MADFCAAHSLGGETEFQLNLVLEELFVNSIRHGGCAGLEDAACILLSYHDGGVRVVFSDRGRPFDPTAAPEPDIRAPLAGRTGGGMGLHLVRRIMREIAYRREGHRNIVTMQYPVQEEQETR